MEQGILEAWRDDYNRVRPHSALGDRTPAEAAARWVDSREARVSTEGLETRKENEITNRFVTISPY